MSFTPGPWRILPRSKWAVKNDDVLQLPIGDDYGCIAWLNKRSERLGSDEANARLIACAPDLLAEVKTLIDVIERGTETPEDLESILEYAKGLIALAGGK